MCSRALPELPIPGLSHRERDHFHTPSSTAEAPTPPEPTWANFQLGCCYQCPWINFRQHTEEIITRADQRSGFGWFGDFWAGNALFAILFMAWEFNKLFKKFYFKYVKSLLRAQLPQVQIIVSMPCSSPGCPSTLDNKHLWKIRVLVLFFT